MAWRCHNHCGGSACPATWALRCRGCGPGSSGEATWHVSPGHYSGTCLLVTVLPHLSWKEDGGCEVVAEADEDSLSVDTCEAGELLVAGSNVFTG